MPTEAGVAAASVSSIAERGPGVLDHPSRSSEDAGRTGWFRGFREEGVVFVAIDRMVKLRLLGNSPNFLILLVV